MSLVGSLEDLGLGDILQIVALSRKSGLLLLQSDRGDGRIVLRDGMVCGAAIKGEGDSLRSLLVDGGFIESAAYDRALEATEGGSIDAALAEVGSLTAERLESLRREHIEHSVVRMFSWRAGEFSFEVRDHVEGQDAELMLPTGINTQYLAMEATRLHDEDDRLDGPGLDGPDASSNVEIDDEAPMFSGEGEAEAKASAFSGPAAEQSPLEAEGEGGPPYEAVVDALALAVARNADEEPTTEYRALLDTATSDDVGPWPVESEVEDEGDPEAAPTAQRPALDHSWEPESGPTPGTPAEIPIDHPVVLPAAIAVEFGTEPPRSATDVDAPRVVTPEPDRIPPAMPSHLVVIDADLCALEWVKAAVEDMYERVHIFQRSEIGIERIRHYLGRGSVPAVLVSQRTPADPLTGSSDVDQLVRRLRSLAPLMPVGVLCEEGRPAPTRIGEAHALLYRPASPGADPGFWSTFADTAAQLRESLAEMRTQAPARPRDPAPAPAPDAPPLARLKDVSARLRDPSSQGDVLSLVLDYAAERFNRVAVFMLRDDRITGMAQLGLARAGGPEDDELRRIELSDDTMPELFRAALESRGAVKAAPTGEFDRRLTSLLGSRPPSVAYAAPIESGGRLVAMLYADELPAEGPLGDTTALEIVLHEAGLALDRALLERALADAESS